MAAVADQRDANADRALIAPYLLYLTEDLRPLADLGCSVVLHGHGDEDKYHYAGAFHDGGDFHALFPGWSDNSTPIMPEIGSVFQMCAGSSALRKVYQESSAKIRRQNPQIAGCSLLTITPCYLLLISTAHLMAYKRGTYST